MPENYSCHWWIQDFPLGGGVVDPLGGHGPLWALFIENVCKNERIGSHGGRTIGTFPISYHTDCKRD